MHRDVKFFKKKDEKLGPWASIEKGAKRVEIIHPRNLRGGTRVSIT